MRIAIVGCGYVADFYLGTLPNHPQVELVGVMDRDPERARRFAAHWKIDHVYPDLQALLDDARVDIVLNLTNPASHFEVSRACLEADKHVYSEKPLALRMEHAQALVDLAAARGLLLSGAPCSILGEAAQTAWKALREGAAGAVRAVYAELDEGMVHRMDYRNWRSESGMPWPWRDEFEMGVSIEHAGYYVTWLVAFFGRARQVTVFNACRAPEKADGALGPDFSVSCIEFDSGVVARLTCSLVTRPDHWINIFGDQATLSCRDGWMYDAPVYLEKLRWRDTRRGKLMERYPVLADLWPWWAHRIPHVRKSAFKSYPPCGHKMDYARGVAEMAEAICEKRACRLSAAFLLHVTEIVLAMQPGTHGNGARPILSSVEPMAPMPWAQGS